MRETAPSPTARYTVTAALIYANGPVHIGHLAGCYLPADIYVRYLRARGEDVCFVSGTDEHGVPITLQAREENCAPQQLIDRHYQQIRKTLKDFGISFDIFDRTSKDTHHKTAQDFFCRLYDRGCFEAQKKEQLYDEAEQLFLADRYIRGSCPGCGYEDAYGDQCESCGRSLNPQELLQPRSIFGGKLTLRETTNWYLPMQKWQKMLEKYVEEHRPQAEYFAEAKYFDKKGEYFDKEGEYLGKKDEYFGKEGEHFDKEGEYLGKKGEYFGKRGEHFDKKGEHFDKEGKYLGKKGEYSDKRGEHFGKKGEYFDKEGEYLGKKGEYFDKKGWREHVYGQCMSWLKEGLQPRAMTRDMDWGVPVPLKEANKKVLYVWFEAPIGYITATQQLHPKKWESYWKKKDTKLVHFIGKDNIVFHCLIFPLMLQLHGDYVLPQEVPANAFLNLEGQKLSTSRGWAVWLHEYLEDFPEQQDSLRYMLSAKMPQNKDTNFTWKEFQARNNNELLATFGNFVHRTMHLAHKFTDAKVPLKKDIKTDKTLENEEVLLGAAGVGAHKTVGIMRMLESFRFQEGLELLISVARYGNDLLSHKAPWQENVPKTERNTIIYDALQLCARLAVVSEPFLPGTAKKLQKLLQLSFSGEEKAAIWNNAQPDRPKIKGKEGILVESLCLKDSILPFGHTLGAPAPLFRRIEDDEIERQIQKLRKPMKEKPASSPAVSEEIDFETFLQTKMHIATVLRCEAVAGSTKLLRFTLDDGERERVILSGIAAHYKPETLVGEQVVFVKNLRPRKIMGEISEGMVLSAVAGDRLRLLRPDELIDAGAKVE